MPKSTSVDPAVYFEKARQKRLVVGINRPPPPPRKGTKKKTSNFSFNEWMKSGMSRPDRAHFEQMKKIMTPLQQENLFMDNDGLVQINHGGSIQEVEAWWQMKVIPGRNISEAVRNYLDWKLDSHWSEYQNPRNLASIRDIVNTEL
ncbi:unnamed protein product, partial [Cuscuta europaea]